MSAESPAEDKAIKCVVILVAMEQEAAPMIAEFKLVLQEDICSVSKCLLYSGEYSGCALHLVREEFPRQSTDIITHVLPLLIVYG